jgi:hypothetical protein
MMRASLQRALLPCSLLLACCASHPQLAPAVPSESEVLREFGFGCAQCTYPTVSQCAMLKKQTTPLVARVSGARVAAQLDECLRSDNPGDSQPCDRSRVLRFAAVQFLKQPDGARANDAFFARDDVDLSAPGKHSGVSLEPDKHYVIFAGRPNDTTRPPADWYVTAACEVPASQP